MFGIFGLWIMQLNKSADMVNEPCFIINLQGRCMYMNRAAERLCDLCSENMYMHQLSAMQASAGEHIEQIFSKLLLRIRNRHQVLSYLRILAQGNSHRQEFRCDLASEPLQLPDNEEAV